MNNYTGSNGKTERNKFDFYPTPKEVTHALMKFLDIPKYYTIWECACGEGEMSSVLNQYVYRVLSTDIRKTNYTGGGIDFLKHTPKEHINAIITNPPFNISEDFIKRALTIDGVSMVAFLLKSQYWHAAKRFKLFNDYPPSHVLPLTWRPDCIERKEGEKKGSPTMDFLWTVWIKGSRETIYKPLTK
jgi:hypothetical protein